jgi:hypothetical protein
MPARFVSLRVTETWKMVEGRIPRPGKDPAAATAATPAPGRAPELEGRPGYEPGPASPDDATCPAIAQ